MCQSKAQGGRRCLAHTRQAYERATAAAAGAKQQGGVTAATRDAYIRAVYALADHPAGRAHLAERAAEIRARSASVGGDDLLVIDAALAPHRAAEADRQARRAAMAEAMSSDTTYEAACARRGLTPDPDRTASPAAESPLARALRTGEPMPPDPEPDGDPLAPVAVAPGVTVPAAQVSMIRRWGAAPVEVRVYEDRPAQGGGYAGYDSATGGWERTDAFAHDAGDGRRHATITTRDPATGASWAVRAVHDPVSGAWVIRSDQRGRL